MPCVKKLFVNRELVNKACQSSPLAGLFLPSIMDADSSVPVVATSRRAEVATLREVILFEVDINSVVIGSLGYELYGLA